MEDVRAAHRAPSPLDHPIFIGALALPGALAGGALAPAAAALVPGAPIPQEAPIFLGAFLGAALSMRLLGGLIQRVATLPDRAGPDGGPRIALAPVRETSTLHLVSALEDERIAGGVAALTLSFLERGQRVLVIDAGLGRPLHAWLGGVPRLGLSECMAERVPVLGLVQRGPASGLWLLARGGSRGHLAWSRLGRVVDEACSHFDRVLLAAPAAVLPSLGYGLSGREAAGWWAAPTRSEPIPAWASKRFGMSLSRLSLPPAAELTPQAVARALARIPAMPDPIPAMTVLPGPAPAPVAAPPPAAPTIVDCDLHVRERLRFLAWMRQVQRENQSGSEAVLTGR